MTSLSSWESKVCAWTPSARAVAQQSNMTEIKVVATDQAASFAALLGDVPYPTLIRVL